MTPPNNTRLARRLLWFAAFVDVALLFMLCSTSGDSAGIGWTLTLFLLVNVSVGIYALKQGLLFELIQEHTWKAVCDGIGFSAVADSWGVGVGLPRRTQKVIYPRLRDVCGTSEAWTGTVMPFAGQTVAEYTKHADAFALAFQVPFVSFELGEYGQITIRAGQVPVPAAYDHPGQRAMPQATHTTRTAHLLPATSSSYLPVQPPLMVSNVSRYPNAQATPDETNALQLLKAVPMARDLNGQPWYMPIEGQHVLIAARTGGGKGSWIWSLVLGLAPAHRAGLVKLWGCDPKRLELAIGRDWWTHYADNEADIVSMLEDCVSEMFERALTLQGKARKFTPSQETPLNVVVVDELGYLSAMLPDKKLRDRAEKAVSTILALGRAVGYSLVGAVQDPRKETVGFRDLFPIRIAGGLPAPMVDLVLGEGMHDAGARCEQIPLGNTGAGVAFVISETNLKPLCVRAAWCGDEVIQQVRAMTAAPTVNRLSEPSDWDNQHIQPFQYGQ